MSLGRKSNGKQIPLWMPSQNIVKAPPNPFYDRLNAILRHIIFLVTVMSWTWPQEEMSGAR